MPSVFSSEGSVTDSARLCENFFFWGGGVELVYHPIKKLVEQYSQDFNIAFNHPLKGLTLENLQARVRGTILMEYSNEFDALLLSTGNKSEISIGYCTLYGDTMAVLTSWVTCIKQKFIVFPYILTIEQNVK